MRLAHFFIDHPVFATVLSLVTIICGLVGLTRLPVSQYPEIVPPTVVVTANYAGADAQTMADTVAAPIEQQVNGVEKMLYMSSQSTNTGQYRLTVTFEVGTNLDIAQVQVQNRVALAEPQLPEDVRRTGVTVRKSSPDITLVVHLFSPDNSLDTLFISNYATLQVRDQLARLQGVGDVTVFGAREYAMRVWLDPQKIAALNLTAGDVVAAIREQNVQVAAGAVGQPPLPPGAADFQLTVSAQGRLTDPQAFAEIVIKTGDDGSITRLRDVARTELGAADYSVNSYLDGKPAVAMGIFQLPGTNSISTADAIYAKMDELSRDFPQGMKHTIVYDTTVFVRESMRDVIKTLFEAIGLVVIVVLVFLQSWRATLIPLLAVPVSLIGTLGVLWAIGYSMNTLTLFGLVLAVCIVVDDAIVVVENIERWIEEGLSPRDAAFKAMGEVTTAVIAIALGLSAVFIPVAFISGITGQFYRQFAVTISAATIISAFNSLTLSPAMAALFLRPGGNRADRFGRILDFLFGWLFRGFNRILGRSTGGYVRALTRVVRMAAVALLVYGGLLVVTYFMFRTVPTSFIPSQDAGYLLVNLQLPDAASLERTDAAARRIADIAAKDPAVAHTVVISGFSLLTGTNQSNTATMFTPLKPFSERGGDENLSSNAAMGRMMGAYSQLQEGIALVFPPPPVRGLSNAGGFRLQVQARGGGSPQELQQVTEEIAAAGQRAAEIQPGTLFSSFRASVPQLYALVDRERVKAQGVAITDLFSTLQVYLGSLYVNDFTFLGRTYRVVAQADTPFRVSAEDVKQLKTRNRAGDMVPLGAVMDVQDVTAPIRINRYNLYPSAELNGSAAAGRSSGEAIAAMERIAEQSLPLGYAYEWTELTYQEKLAGNTAIYIFPLCVLFVWLTHAAEYESFALSTAIILIVPMCLLFGIAGVWFSGMDNNIFTQIGFVVLAGLSAKNAVLIVEFAKQQEEREGKSPFEAAIAAAEIRLRPILMTSFAFILGVLPLVLAEGPGAEMRHALGTAVFYGMIGVTFFGIFLTPVFYVVIRRLSGNKPLAHASLSPATDTAAH